MVKVNKASDFLIRETTIRLLWELHNQYQKKEVVSGSKIARILGMDSSHALDYMRNWHTWGLLKQDLQENTKHTYSYFSLNPEFFNITEDTVGFIVGNIEVTLKEVPKKDGRRI